MRGVVSPKKLGKKKDQPSIRRACDRCRARKSKCSGDYPICTSCLLSDQACQYGSRTPSQFKHQDEIDFLREEVNRLKSILCENKTRPNELIAKFFLRTTENNLESSLSGPGNDDGTVENTTKPVGIGTMVLSQSGSLELDPELTFFRPGIPFKMKSLGALQGMPFESLSYQDNITWLPHQAPYLPLPVDRELHDHLLDLCFDFGISFGMNAFKDEFIKDMQTQKTKPNHYFSPLLHLSCLAVGYRYLSVNKQIAFLQTLQDMDKSSDISLVLIAKARVIAEEEVCEPSLVTILGLLVLSLSCFGMAFDRVGTMYYSMAMSLAQEFRVHQRCDEQLKKKHLLPGCKLDVLRRDICGFLQIYTCWYMQYVARLTVPIYLELDQRAPMKKQNIRGGHDYNRNHTSEAFYCHVKLSQIGTEIFYCNHVWQMTLEERKCLVQHYVEELQQWRASLPAKFQLSQTEDGARRLHPSTATLLAEYDAYIIQLLRPYLTIGIGDGAQIDAFEFCIFAADEAINLIRHIKDHYGGRKAPLCLQMMMSIVGTFLVLCASGIANSSRPIITNAKTQLSLLLCWLDEFAEIWPTTAQCAETIRRLMKEYCTSAAG